MSDNKCKPNLFNFATSELSQDAFIAWLASWADQGCRNVDSKMHQLGEKFLVSLVPSLKNEEITSVKATRQFKKIDLVIDVNKKHLIVIEDKTSSGEHSKQLEKYKKNIEDEVLKEKGDYQNRKPHFIYFKTGDEIKRSPDSMFGFQSYMRSDFLKVLSTGLGVDNEILRDFTDRLQEWEDRVSAYKEKPMKDWEYDQWTGFFVHLCDHINKKYGTKSGTETKKYLANFGHVNNSSGGFQAAWFGFEELSCNPSELECKIYFQFEAKPIKIEANQNKDAKRIEKQKYRPDLTLRIATDENTKEATKRFRDKIETDGTLDAIKENPFLQENNILINQKNLRSGKSMRILSFEGVADSRSVDQIIEVIDTLIEFRIQEQKR